MLFGNENSRVEAFSDGVYAIAITLLVIEIKVPPLDSVHSAQDLWGEIWKLWPSFFAFVLSFGFTLISWINHHHTFNLINQSSSSFFYANGFLLFTVALLPFSTALLAAYIGTDYVQPAVVFYCFTGFLQNAAWFTLLYSITKSQLLKNSPTAIDEFKRRGQYSITGLTIYFVNMVFAWWFPLPALGINTLLWLVWIILGISSKKIDRYAI